MTVQTLRGVCDDPSDTLHISLDGVDLGTVVCDGTDGAYVAQTFSVAGYNDDATHTLNIGGTVGGTNATHTNFFVDDVTIYDHIPTDGMPSVCTQILPDASELGCNMYPVGFESGIPASWNVIDNEGNSVVWSDIAGASEDGNYTGGLGDAATVSSDRFGTADFDTELRSNVFNIPASATAVTLDYLANYQNYANEDFLDVDISTDGGATWTNILSWNEDHGGMRALPGEAVSLDLAAYIGMSDLQLRWRYHDPEVDDWEWYAQIDDAVVNCDGVPWIVYLPVIMKD